MSLIIALFLIIILLCRVVNDKSKEAEYDRKKNAEDRLISDWESLYIDKALEENLTRCIEDENNYAAICEEVFSLLPDTEHWRHLKAGYFYLTDAQVYSQRNYKQAREKCGRDKKMALDIMLASRGKISWTAAHYGYSAYISGSDYCWRERDFEYAETILKLLRIRGVQIKLYYRGGTHRGNYVWEGSSAGIKSIDRYETVMDFDRSVLFKENSIPPTK